MMQCLFDQPLQKTLKWFSWIWFFLRSGFSWIIWHQRNDMVLKNLQWPIGKTRQVNWDALQDYDRIEWKRTLKDLEKTLDMAYHDFLNEFDLTWGQRPYCHLEGQTANGSYFLISTRVALARPCWLCIGSFLAIEFSICAQKKLIKKI